MQRQFYATADDLMTVFATVERKHQLTYTLTGLFETRALIGVELGADIPSLQAPAPSDSAMSCPTYLVTPTGTPVNVRDIPQNRGGVLYAVDQLENPDSITLSPGGFFRRDVLLSGRVATASDSRIAARLYRAFAGAIDKHFVRVRAFRVGPQAFEQFQAGCRLTSSAASPKEFDLAADAADA